MVGKVSDGERAGQGSLVAKLISDAGVVGGGGHKSSIFRQEFMDVI